MYYADLLSAAFLHVTKTINCDNAPIVNPMLPPPLSKYHKVECDPDIAPYLDMNFRRSDVESEVLENLTITPSDSWRYFADRPGKYGLISEVTPSAPKSSVSIPFGEIETNSTIIIMVSYLRSYEFASVADIRICGEYVLTLDALWDDYSSNHISVTHTSAIEGDYRGLSIADVIHENCKGPQNTIEFYSPFGHEKKDPAKRAARGYKQKFKIESVKVCRKGEVDADLE
jgi:hypothetical protein